ncbi:MAG: hypothetical protein IPP94_11685 [Ignavibacteria bacterium]|nr:hypothetical protein [Ignavibacteria bacterium]
MRRVSPAPLRTLPSTVMMWTVNDRVIEDPDALRAEFEDIATAGFRGITAIVRCSHYAWPDAPAMQALAAIGELCRARGLAYWVCADPRQSSARLEAGKGATIVTCGSATWGGIAPHTVAPRGGRYSLRCDVLPRPSHILTEGAVEYAPDGLERVVAFRPRPGEAPTAIDITAQSRFHWHAADRSAEVFGRFDPPANGPWRIMAFFRFRTNVFDFGDTDAMDRYIGALRALAASGVPADAVLWDEPGYLCMDGSFPFTPAIRARLKRDGIDLSRELWTLMLPAGDGRHIAVRNAYFRAVQTTVVQAQQRARRETRRLWGRGAIMGMHDTWRWESASCADRNHGSFDLWRALDSKDCGFADLGSVNLLETPGSAFHANLAAMSVVAASLGRHSATGAAYNNLWTTGEDGGALSQRRIMEHCVHVMAVFGLRWSAHIYGPAGTLGRESSFLGLPFTPGYPNHATWQGMPEWTELLERHRAPTEGRLPRANLLVVLPVESLFAADGPTADAALARIFRLLLSLLDRHYHPELIASSMLDGVVIKNGGAAVNGRAYDAVVWPYGDVLSARLLPRIRAAARDIHWLYRTPSRSDDGAMLPRTFRSAAISERALFSALARNNATLRPVTAPARSWASITDLRDGALLSLAPARAGGTYAGLLRYGGRRLRVSASDGLRCFFFPKNARPFDI